MKREEEYIDLKEIILKYFRHWKLICMSALVCFVVAFCYYKITSPVYEINANILIKQDAKSSGAASLMKNFSFGLGLGGSSGIDDDLNIISSYSMFMRAVEMLNLNDIYTEKTLLGLKETDRYSENVFKIDYNKSITDTLKTPLKFNVNIQKDGKTSVKFYDHRRNSKVIVKDNLHFPFTLNTEIGAFHFSLTDLYVADHKYNYEVVILNKSIVTEQYRSQVEITNASKKSNVVELMTLDSNTERGKDLLNLLIKLYNDDAMEENSYVSANTSVFLKDRLQKLSLELSDIENEIEQYKKRNNIVNVEIESKFLFEQTNDLQKSLLELSADEITIDEILYYVEKPINEYSLIPTGALKTSSSESTFADYNKLILERASLLQTTNAHNPLVKNLDAQINMMRSNLSNTLRNIKSTLLLSKKDIEDKLFNIDSRFKESPTIEKEFLDIKRKQMIKEQLVIFIMEKQEENELLLNISTPKAKIIDAAHSLVLPQSPKKNVILLLGLIAGAFIAILMITIYDILHTAILTKKQLSLISEIPTIGEVSKNILYHNEPGISQDYEEMDIIRQNLQFILTKKNEKVILFASMKENDGKSFIISNLAASIARSNKKTLIIDLNIRDSQMKKYFKITSDKGITNYIIDEELALKDIIYKTEYKNLDVITAGAIPPNASELIKDEKINKAVESLKNDYDYILLNSSPITVSGDSFILNEISDKIMFIVKSGSTSKKNVELLNQFVSENKFKNLFMILNYIKQ